MKFTQKRYEKKIVSIKYLLLRVLWLQCGHFVISVLSQSQILLSSNSQSTITNTNTSVVVNISKSEICECIEYWSCAAKNGQFYSYCGISDSEVCCYKGTGTVTNQSIFTIHSNSTENTNQQSGSTNSSEPIWSPVLPPITEPCGIASIPGNLDSFAEFKEWPWHIAILEAKDDLYICGGTLISPKHVLSAAHCVHTYLRKNSRLKIRAGEYDVSTNLETSPHVELLVKTVTLHPNFSNSSLVNDIAILELVRKIPIQNRDNIALVCLPTLNQKNLTTPGRCVVTGWGRLNEQSDHSFQMKEIIVPVWERDQCERKLGRTFGPEYKLPDTALCAGDEGKDACDGDGGGPLVCFQDGKWVQHGIVSFGVGCGRRELPGVYTRVFSFLSWIKAELDK